MTRLRSQEVGGGGTTPNATVTVTTRIISALRWAAERAIFTFYSLQGAKSQDSVHKPQHFKRKEGQQGTVPVSSTLPLGPAGPLVYRVFSKEGFYTAEPS